MMQRTMLSSFPTLARFKIPEDRQAKLDAVLEGRGLSPDRWFCVLHYRESNYAARHAVEARNFDPDQAISMIRHIVEAIGGQVVRIGHSGMATFPEIAGFVDLSMEEDGFLLQANAVARSRFFLELSSSGPMSLAPALGVPVARCNAVGPYGAVDENGLVLLKRIFRPDGRLMTADEMMTEKVAPDTVMNKFLIAKGYRYVSNSLEELKAVVDEMIFTTGDATGWREQDPPLSVPPNRLEWPMPIRSDIRLPTARICGTRLRPDSDKRYSTGVKSPVCGSISQRSPSAMSNQAPWSKSLPLSSRILTQGNVLRLDME